MARPRSVKPRLQSGRPGWVATFTDATGKRSTRGLGTRDEVEAKLICSALTHLAQHGCAELGDAPVGTPRRALVLFFGEEQVEERALPLVGAEHPDAAPIEERELRELPPALQARVVGLQLGHRQLALEVDALREELERAQTALKALQATTLGRAVEASKNCPPMAEALALFAEHMASTSTAKHAGEVARIAKRFAEQLPGGVRTPGDITAEHISRWLDADAAGSSSPVARRAKRRTLLGRFVNWSADLFEFPSPMRRVKSASAQQLQRERGGIDWHELPEVDAALEALPAVYWRPLVATLAFAGLRRAELVWIRRADVLELADGRRQLWITSVDDGHGEAHHLKTGNSERAVDIHPRRLWPLLEQHLARPAVEGGAGELFLFPIPPGIRRRPRAAGHPERWQEDTLSRKLSGIPWRVEAAETPEAADRYRGLLPDGMSASSLRRTFGSLLLRSGRSVEEVAASMGNTPEVVRRHYARHLGSEVSVEF